MKEGKLVILSAPSGTGKTTICRELLKRNPKWLFSISVTTREKRENEIRDKDYIFITNEKFDHLIKFGDLLEYEWVHGNRYGTLMVPLEDAIDNKKILLLDIDVKGSCTIMDEFGENVEVIGGSIATKKAAQDLCEWGVDGIRVGIGNGSLCETRIRTGVGLPQVSVLSDVCSVADTYNVPCIADGGVRYVGDVAKGLGAGADSVMLGSIIAGTKETPGNTHKVGEWPNEKLYKKYRGSASLDSKSDRGEYDNVEGNSKIIPYKGKVNRIISDIRDGLSSAFSYVGASDVLDFQSKCEFVQVTQAGVIEAKPHLL